MRFLKNSFILGLLIISFSALSTLEPYLHAHEFDLTEVEDDCAPCQWTQHNVQMESASLSLDYDSLTITVLTNTSTLPKSSLKNTYFGLSPPLHS